MNRREFLGTSLLAATAALGATRLPIKKALYISMLGRMGSYADRFQMARDAGFEEIECATVDSQSEAEEIKKAAEKTNLRIHSVMNQAHWKYPLSSSDPAVVDHSIKGMETSLRNASFWGADTVLLVPAVVNPETSYRDAWTRSQQQIRKLVPLAEKLKVVIAIEEVWNKFLLSPLEMARYVDEFKSPWVKAYLDVGNMVFYGYPQDWVRTLDKRIAKLHIKDFSWRRDPATKKQVADWVPLGEGDIDWHAIYAALSEIGYKGTATVELPAGGAPYLKEVNRRLNAILENRLA